jgi:SpoIVB peptidase S55
MSLLRPQPAFSRLIGSVMSRRASMGRLLLACSALLVAAACARAADPPPTIPLDQIQPGMAGVGYTIFAGNQIEKFDLEVLGILPNLLGPRQSIILVQLKGPHVEHTGVVAGMSGSPVYIDGKLAGALSLKFGQFNKEPLAGVTPIQDMLSLPVGDGGPSPGTTAADAAAPQGPSEVAALSPAMEGPRYPLPGEWARAAGVSGGAFLQPIASPLVLSGFAPASWRQFAGDWEAYGMMATPGGSAEPQADDAQISPGDMVSMMLVQGDLSMNASCTVTAVTDDRVYACGHPLFGLGGVRMPMARGRVVTTLASEMDSTKIVNAGGVIGTLTQDRLTAVMGRLGSPPPMIPVTLSVVTPDGEKQINVQMISDRKLTPLLAGMVFFNGLTQNTNYGEGTTLRLTGSIEIAGHAPVVLENMYTPTDQLTPDGALVAAGVQGLFNRIFSNPYETPEIERVTLRVDSLPDRRLVRIENAWSDTSEAAPGESVLVKVMLRPYRGAPVVREVPITIPLQATRGTTLRAMVSDSDSLNRIPNLLATQGRLASLDQLITLLNRTRRNDRVYVTLLKPAPTLLLGDKELPGAPLSQLNVLSQTLPADSALLRETALGEWSVQMDQAVAGTASVTIKVQ